MRCSKCGAPDIWQIGWSTDEVAFARLIRGLGSPRVGSWIARGKVGFPGKLGNTAPGFYCFGCFGFRMDAKQRLAHLADDVPPPAAPPRDPPKPRPRFELDSALAALRKVAEKRALEPHVIQQPRPAQTASPSGLRGLRPPVAALLTRDLYRHQYRAIELGLEGKDVVVATATASGKSLCYQTLAAQCLAAKPGATVLYLAPLNALVMDQLDAFERFFTRGAEPKQYPDGQLETYLRSVKLGRSEIAIARYDGAVPKESADGTRIRTAIRDAHPRLVLTNPEMLAQALLPRASRNKGPEIKADSSAEAWAPFFRGLTAANTCADPKGLILWSRG